MEIADTDPKRLLIAVALIVLTFGCAKRSEIVAADNQSQRVDVQAVDNDRSTRTASELEKLLAAGDWQAVGEAKRLGKQALEIVRRFAKDRNYTIRQISVSCAGAIGEQEGADILISGLSDENVNVRLAAARALSERAYPAAADAVLGALGQSSDETLRELLVKAAGYYPGSKTSEALRPLAVGDSVLAKNAVFALAKIGDPSGRKLLGERLSAPLPRTRYEALEGLCYVGDKGFADRAKKLLSDNAVGLRIGSTRNPRYRKVADQAVDSLVCLLGLKPGFEVSAEKTYSNSEIATIRKMAR